MESRCLHDIETRTRRLVYGILNDNLVLLPLGVATAVAEDLEGIFELKTYGEARRFEPQVSDGSRT